MDNTTNSTFDIHEVLNQLLKEHKTTQMLVSKSKDEVIENTSDSIDSVGVKLEDLKKTIYLLQSQLFEIKNINLELKKELSNNTSNKIIQKIGIAFFILFSISILLTVINGFELVNFTWAKLGFIISGVIYLIGLFIGRMYKQVFNGTGNY